MLSHVIRSKPTMRIGINDELWSNHAVNRYHDSFKIVKLLIDIQSLTFTFQGKYNIRLNTFFILSKKHNRNISMFSFCTTFKNSDLEEKKQGPIPYGIVF